MRTNREGNLKRFFDIKETDFVLEVQGDVLVLREAEYDYIFWEPSGAGEKTACVQNLYSLLSSTGKLVVYFDNPLSIHAFAGGLRGECPRDVGYPLLTALLDTLAQKGEMVYSKCYYPYPSVSFPVTFFSDSRLPGEGECEDNYYNFEHAELEVFDERKVTGHIVATGMYPYLAHAYMLVISKKPLDEYPDYTRFSNERRTEKQIRTDLYHDYVLKSAVTTEAKTHVLRMREIEKALSESLHGLTLLGRECVPNKMLQADEISGSVRFAYENGKSLEQTLDEMLGEGREAEVEQILLSFCDSLKAGGELAPFEMTEEFREIFGELPDWQSYGWKSLPVSDIDLVSQNILLSEKAVVIDYEWTFEFPVPVEFLVFRFLYFYLEAKNRICAVQKELSDIYVKAGITEDLKEVFLAMETGFQHWVQHGAKVLCNSFDEDGKPVLKARELARQLEMLEGRVVTIAGKDGARLCVNASRVSDGICVYKLPETGETAVVELTGFDASEEGAAKVLRLGAMANRGGSHAGLSLETNGMHLGGLLYLYENCMPQLTVSGFAQGDDGAEISVEEISMSKSAVREIKTTIADMRFIIDNREQQIRDLKNSASWKVTKPLRMLKGSKEE